MPMSTARLDATLALPEDFTEDALSAHAYFVPGFLVTYNTTPSKACSLASTGTRTSTSRTSPRSKA